jgi:hypothetical protein
MTLDRSTGALGGDVLSGQFSGARLGELGLDQLSALLAGPSEPGLPPCGRTRPERRDHREMLSDALDPCSIS